MCEREGGTRPTAAGEHPHGGNDTSENPKIPWLCSIAPSALIVVSAGWTPWLGHGVG